MIDQQAYLKAPCRASSLPYWKTNSFVLPSHMRVQREEEYVPDAGWAEERYFKLMHSLLQVDEPRLPEGMRFALADGRQDAARIAALINACYTDISVEEADVISWTELSVYCPELWVYVLDDEQPVALGIAELDAGIGEGILDWVQVLPSARGQGVGKALVNELLRRMKGRADFATVSGKADNPCAPARLYQACGFSGEVIWHVQWKIPERV